MSGHYSTLSHCLSLSPQILSRCPALDCLVVFLYHHKDCTSVRALQCLIVFLKSPQRLSRCMDTRLTHSLTQSPLSWCLGTRLSHSLSQSPQRLSRCLGTTLSHSLSQSPQRLCLCSGTTLSRSLSQSPRRLSRCPGCCRLAHRSPAVPAGFLSAPGAQRKQFSLNVAIFVASFVRVSGK